MVVVVGGMEGGGKYPNLCMNLRLLSSQPLALFQALPQYEK